MIGHCRDVREFKKIRRIGEGTYGLVYKAMDRETKEEVALKRVLLHHESKEGFPQTSLREIRILQQYCDHNNIVRLLDIATGEDRNAVFLVYELCDHDLLTLSRTVTLPFTESEVKRLALQLLSAVHHLHRNWVIHRDLKPSNLLYNSRGQLKICDFGLARCLPYPRPPSHNITPGVTTLWYRAPEILLGSEHYSFAVDIWSIGLILAELLNNGAPLLPGNDDMDQIKLIFSLLGCPNNRIWPALSQLPLVSNGALDLEVDQARYVYNNMSEIFSSLHPSGVELLNELLIYDPLKRLDISGACVHPYFNTSPLPQLEEFMPTFPSL